MPALPSSAEKRAKHRNTPATKMRTMPSSYAPPAIASRAESPMHYIYTFRGDGRTPVEPVSATDQRAAIQALLATLAPSALAVPRTVLASLPPRPSGYGRTRELFPRYTGVMFDAISPAVVASDHTISELLEPARAARLVEQHALDPALPGLEEVIAGTLAATGPMRAIHPMRPKSVGPCAGW